VSLDLRCGDWREVLADVGEVDAVICDPPYGARTHAGNEGLPERYKDSMRSDLSGYANWTPADAAEFIAAWSDRCRGWFGIMTSDDLITPIRDAYSDAKRLDFAPVPILQHRVRMGGDGPGSGAVYLMVARPRRKEFLSWGSLPCWYMSQPDKTGIVNGAKPESLMRAIIGDYTRPGDLVCDPCAGGATTLLAAYQTGRRAIGAELDPATYAKAKARLDRAMAQPHLFDPGLAKAVQNKMF
jgi:hypothetical protein